MKNLAGDNNCDPVITAELMEAGIEVVKLTQPLNGEVPASVTGKLGEFTFTRAWYYWVVDGNVPLEVANEMYASETGKKDIRVNGHCGCPPPNEWAFPEADILWPQLEAKDLLNTSYGDLAKMCDRAEITGDRFVSTYHIDSQEGLSLFTATLRKHNLV